MIDICYYSSDFYAPYTGISMYSLLKNNKDLNFRLHCIDCGISEDNKHKMQLMANDYGKEFIFHDYTLMEKYIRDDLQLPVCNGSYATYIKIFPDKIFSDYDNILFIDGDTIINGSLEPLFETKMHDQLFAAVKVSLINESWIYDENDPSNLRLQYSLKFHNVGYYNIGVFLINLKKWKEIDFGKQIMKTADEHLEIISKADDIPIDEMLINLTVLKKENQNFVHQMPSKFNCVSHNIPFRRALAVNLKCGYIDKNDFIEAYYHPVIIHFCIFKPWFTDTYSIYSDEIQKYRLDSPWYDAFTSKRYNNIISKLYSLFIYPMQNEFLIRIIKKARKFCKIIKK